MCHKRILLCMPHLSGNELKFVEEAFKGSWIVPLGPDVDAFETELHQFLTTPERGHTFDNQLRFTLEKKKIVALSAGTAALHLALVAAGIGPGDDVMVQSFTFCASAHPVKYVGANPVFVDSEADTWNMDPDLLDKAIADRIAKTGKIPKGIIPVHLYGMPAKMDRILKIGEKYGIPVFEDAAEALGSSFKGQQCGTFGQFGILSFNGNKMITTSGGGAVVVPDRDTAKNIMFYATQSRESFPYYQHEEIGYNYRMSNISAAIGRGQLTVLDNHIAHHRHIQSLYRDLLADIEGIRLHDNPDHDFDSNFWLCTITLDDNICIIDQENAYSSPVSKAIGGAGGVTHTAGKVHSDFEPDKNVEALRLALLQANIESRPLWKPMHRQPVYADSPAYINGVSDNLFRHGLCLPAGPCVTDEDVEKIVCTIRNAIVK